MKKHKRSFKDWFLDQLYSLIPLGELIIAVTLVIGYIMVFVVIILNAHKLKWFFVPTLIAYLLPIFFIKYFLEKRDAENHIRALGGDELYADLYPKEAEKLARKKAKAEAKKQKELQRAREARGPEF